MIENKEEINVEELQVLSENIRNTQRMVDTPPSGISSQINVSFSILHILLTTIIVISLYYMTYFLLLTY